MKIAFVTYPTAALLPPYHGSMGATIYAIASALAKSCEVLVYGLEDKQMGAKSEVYEGARYRFFPSSAKDRLFFKNRERLSRLVQISSPISTSELLFPAFGRQVARDLEKEQCDVIHVQHCSQYVPVIHALNPTAKIVLHIHAEWFSQCNLAVIERRLRPVDLLLTVSDYVTRKTQHDIRAIADRCEAMYNGIDAQEFDREKDYNHSAAEPKSDFCILAAPGRTRESMFCWMRSRSLLRDIHMFDSTLSVPRGPTLSRNVSICAIKRCFEASPHFLSKTVGHS